MKESILPNFEMKQFRSRMGRVFGWIPHERRMTIALLERAVATATVGYSHIPVPTVSLISLFVIDFCQLNFVLCDVGSSFI